MTSAAESLPLPTNRNAASTNYAPTQSLVQIDQARNLRYDHDEIIQRAVTELRRTMVGCLTQAGCFSIRSTLLELQRLHEAVAGAELMRHTFKRRMQPRLVATETHARGIVGK